MKKPHQEDIEHEKVEARSLRFLRLSSEHVKAFFEFSSRPSSSSAMAADVPRESSSRLSSRTTSQIHLMMMRPQEKKVSSSRQTSPSI